MKKQSVDVLDEADRFERMLNWQLFKQENEQNLRVMHGEKWTPGVPLYGMAIGSLYLPGSEVSTSAQRYMFDLFEEDAGLDTPDTLKILSIWGNCPDCLTMWDTHVQTWCWNCGQDQFLYEYEPRNTYTKAMSALHAYAGEDRQAQLYMAFAASTSDFDDTIVQVWLDAHDRVQAAFNQFAEEITISTRGITEFFTVLDEASPNLRAIIDDRLSPAPTLQLRSDWRETGYIEWPADDSIMEREIPLPDPPFPEFRPEDESRLWINQNYGRRNR